MSHGQEADVFSSFVAQTHLRLAGNPIYQQGHKAFLFHQIQELAFAETKT